MTEPIHKKLLYWIFIVILIILIVNNKKQLICDAAPSTSSTNNNVLRQVAPKKITNSDTRTQVTTKLTQIGNLTRSHGGDIFFVYDSPKCDTDTCVGLSSGTADILENGSISKQKFKSTDDNCKCQCLSHLTAYREDLGICVDDIHECTLVPFVSGSTSERIPFVFLPLRGQIIYPSKEITFTDSPICSVSGSQFLTNTGWSELRSPIDTDVPFRLFRDEGRTFLQWLGEPELRQKMQGRLILVHLLCHDMTPLTLTEINKSTDDNLISELSKTANQNIFTPCVAFRVVGTPVKHVNNVTEVSFSSDTQTDIDIGGHGLSTKEYVVIAICSLLLGLIYVASVFLYLHMKKRKSESHSGSMRNAKSEINYPKNDEVIFSTGFNRNGSITNFGGQNHTNIMGGRSLGNESGRHSMGHRNMGTNMSNNIAADEMGIVKNNPLLNHFTNLNDNSGFISDLSNSNSEGDEERKVKNQMQMQQTSVMIHPSAAMQEMLELDHISQMHERCTPSPSQENECLPEESVSITEDMSAEDKLENMRAIVNGTMRRKLYFNPAYFEPHLLQSPPPAAIEFLTKIREVITIAKYKMATKKYLPSLIEIPEEFPIGGNSEIYSNSAAVSSRRGSIVSLKHNNARHKPCTGCPGCEEMKHADIANCRNCGDKRNSIRKWLEGVSANDNESSSDPDNEKRSDKSDDLSQTEDSLNKVKTRLGSETSSSSDSDTIKANSIKSKRSIKGMAPPIPTSTPKIISTSMKSDSQEIQRDVSMKMTTKSEERELSNNKLKTNIEKTYAKLIDTENNSIDIYQKTSNLSHQNTEQRSKIYDKVELYNKLSGNEIYNNPQFQHTSPIMSSRNKNNKQIQKSSMQYIGRKHIEVLDQFANPNPIDRRHYEMMRNIHHMPDMVYEALTMDYTKMNTFRNRDYDRERQFNHFNSPTPDYHTDEDNTLKRGQQYEDPYVPTPDYNTYGRIPKKHQPDSPIYSRKSPHYLIVDYETDSLERSSSNKNRNSISPPSGSSDMSSQVSPSLSSALPMEEEVEIRNAVYDRVEGFRKDSVQTKINKNGLYEDISFIPSMISEVYIHNMKPNIKNLPPKIKYNTPCEGSMTIEVEHSPIEYDVSTDSDQFEPDTLDRKPKKLNNRPWSKYMIKSEECLNENDEHGNYSSLENVTSLPDLNHLKEKSQLIIKTSINSITSDESNIDDTEKATSQRSFGSLREIYEAKNQKNLQRPSLNNIDFMEKGRILTLDARHSRRQRKTNDGSLKKRVPPDVVPFDRMTTIYDNPKNITEIEDGNVRLQNGMTKNLKTWNTDDKTKEKNQKNTTNNNKNIFNDKTVNELTTNKINGMSETKTINNFIDTNKSVLNDNIEYIGDTYFKDYSKINKLSKFNSLRKSPESKSFISENNGCFINEMENNNDNDNDNNNNESYGILENFITLGDVRNKHFINNNNNENKIYNNSDGNDSCRTISPNCDSPGNEQTSSSSSNNSKVQNIIDDDTDKIEIISSKSLSSCSNLSINKNARNILTSTKLVDTGVGVGQTTKIFRVEINQATHGMQIALGLKDRVKKSNEIKNAWKRFKNIATSKFNSNKNENNNKIDSSDYYEKTSVLSEHLDRDEGIFSLNDDNITIVEDPSQIDNLESRLSPKSELDSGYMSADSNESRRQNKRYERYNFKARGNNCGNNNIYDVIEDVPLEISDKQIIDIVENNKIIISPIVTPRNSIDKRKTNEIISTHKNCIVEIKDPIEVNVYSSDDERYSSEMSSESDEDFGGAENECESGAESVETHSVLFKNIRKQID